MIRRLLFVWLVLVVVLNAGINTRLVTRRSTNASTTVTAISYTPAVTSTNTGGVTLRNNGGDFYVGFVFTVTPATITVSAIGRYKTTASGADSASHNVRIITAAGVSVANATVNMSNTADADGYVYVTLGSPVVLSTGITYWVVSQEANGVDHFYDLSVALTTTADIAISTAGYWDAAISSSGTGGTMNNSYVPMSFKYAP